MPAPDATNLHALSGALTEVLTRVAVAQGPGALAREFVAVAPGLHFREVLVRGGWYRLGGVVDGAGQRVADNLEHWAAAALAEHDDDMQALADACADSTLHATRLTGKTHYWVAPTGPAPDDFLQVEIEELQEVLCHPLFNEDSLPGSVEELVDPEHACATTPPLGMAFYQLRRVIHAGSFLAAMRRQKPEAQAIHRFVDAWSHSSAGAAVQFSHHWVLAVREHLDSFRQTICQATPVAALNGLPPRFDSDFGARGLALFDALQRFDRQIGYPMAWFFHTLTTKTVPHAVAVAVVEDMNSGFSYLPERDIAAVKDWLHRPYGF